MNAKETKFTSLYNGICCYVLEGKNAELFERERSTEKFC